MAWSRFRQRPRRGEAPVAGAAAMFAPIVAVLTVFALVGAATAAAGGRASGEGARDGGAKRLERHSRPRALAVDARGDLLFVALSTADRVAVLDVSERAPAQRPRLVAELPLCRFPTALAPLPGGGVVVACRFDPVLRIVRPASAAPTPGAAPRFEITARDAGPEHGHAGVVVDPQGKFAYVASPPLRGVKIVPLTDATAPVRVVPTGLSPRAMRHLPAAPRVGRPRALLLVSNFIDHTVTVHAIDDDGGLMPAQQTIATEAPVLDLAVVPDDLEGEAVRAGATRLGRGATGVPFSPGALLLLTHEDRTLDRKTLSVEGLDSVLLMLPPNRDVSSSSAASRSLFFLDAGPGKRTTLNLSERSNDPVVELEALALDATGSTMALVGGGTDNLLVGPPSAETLTSSASISVGANPSAVAFLPDGRVAIADRLSDTVSIADTRPARPSPSLNPRPRVVSVTVGEPARHSPAEHGELLFFSRALVPNNVATGPLSLYTCAACHPDGHIDGRQHPAKRNRFFSMTKSCRGLEGTEPFLSLGRPEDLAEFADNIVASHAQGGLTSPDTFDVYPVQLRARSASGWRTVTLSPKGVRAALAAYMAAIPVEPSPFVSPGRHVLTDSERQGLAIFRSSCGGCHQLVRSTLEEAPASTAAPNTPRARRATERALLTGAFALTSARLHDVGTRVLGEGGNNPPSLRGVWHAAPYFTDGSARTLEEVLRRTNPDAPKVHAPENAQHPSFFSPSDLAALLSLLRAL